MSIRNGEYKKYDKCPVGSVISFPIVDSAISTKEIKVTGKVTRLLKKYCQATVNGIDESIIWKVPYHLIEVKERSGGSSNILEHIEKIANMLLEKHGLTKKGWVFGFDLAPVRAGICYYKKKVINLSISFCHSAKTDDILDTILHEIAHALVGSGFGHGPVWARKAREIGCTSMRCHSVKHTTHKWVGFCGEGCSQNKFWKRHRLSKTVRYHSYCNYCKHDISWKRNFAA